MSDYTEHARLSPSGSKRWFACPGSLVMESFIPAPIRQAADEGTACHVVAAWCLTEHRSTESWVGREIKVSGKGESDRFVEFTDEMAELVTQYVREIRYATIGPKVKYWIEQRVEFSRFVDVPDQFGTADTIIYDGDIRELQIRDAKFGHREVPVERNSQLLLYALGAYDMLSMAEEIEHIRIAIHQPKLRKGAIEWTCTVDELLEFAKLAHKKAQRVELAAKQWHPVTSEAEAAPWYDKFLNPKPNEVECAYCRAMATCPKARAEIEKTVGMSFEAVAETKEPARNYVPDVGIKLDAMMAAAPFLEDMVTAIRSKMESHLLSGGESTLFGLELGRQGMRRWDDPAVVEDILRNRYRLTISDAFNLKLKSPTQIEKLTAAQGKTRNGKDHTAKNAAGEQGVIGPTQWAKLQAMIVRNPAKPSVKPKSTIKTPYKAGLTGESFQPVAEAGDDMS